MSRAEIDKKLKHVIADIFEIDIHKVTPNIDAKNLEQWDSLNHMNLIIAIEQEFDLEIDEDMILELMSFKTLSDYLVSAKV
jgi:acyl carrier protein